MNYKYFSGFCVIFSFFLFFAGIHFGVWKYYEKSAIMLGSGYAFLLLGINLSILIKNSRRRKNES